MIGHFPVTLLLPGLLFMAAGFFNRGRAKAMDQESAISKRIAESTMKSANLSIMLGMILLTISIPLALMIRSML